MGNFVDGKWQADFESDMNGHEPNDITREAIREAERLTADPRTQYFSDVEEALTELNKD